MGSMSSKPVTDALDDIARSLKQGRGHEEIGQNDDSLVTSMDSGCHLDDPRSPSSDIVRTPIHAGLIKPQLTRGNEDVFMLFDPRSPGVPRTPIYADEEDDDEEEINFPVVQQTLALDVTPSFCLPSDSSTPYRPAYEDDALNRSLERSLSDSNLSNDAQEDKLLIRSSSTLGQNRTVTKLRRSMKLARNLVRQRTAPESPLSTRPSAPRQDAPSRQGLKSIDVNSPRAFVQKKAALKIEGLKRRNTPSSPFKIETQDKENLPYS